MRYLLEYAEMLQRDEMNGDLVGCLHTIRKMKQIIERLEIEYLDELADIESHIRWKVVKREKH